MNVMEIMSKDLSSIIALANLNQKLAYTVYNVQGYGAKGDGVTDDTAAINKAIQAAMDNKGGVVFFPPGTYVVAYSLQTVLQSGVYLCGSGPKATIIKHTHDTADLIHIGSVAAGWGSVVIGAGISDLSIEHNSTRSSGVSILMENAQQIKVKNISFKNAYVFAQLGSATDINSIFTVIEDCIGSLAGSGIGIDIRGGSNGVHLLSLQFNNEYLGTAIRIAPWNGFDTFIVDNCLFQRFQYGILIQNSTLTVQNAFISNTFFDGTDLYSLLIQPSGSGYVSRFNFDSCWFTSRNNHAVLLDAPSTAIVDGVFFSDCEWVTVGKSGIYLNSSYVINWGVDNSTLANCSTLGNNLYPAIDVVAGCKKFSITNNLIGEAGITVTKQSYGIRLGSDCDLYDIADNRMIGNITAAISDAGGSTFQTKLIKDNLGYNPKGNLTAPVVPTSGTVQKNTFSFPVEVFIYGGTVTNIAKNGSNIPGMASGSMLLYPGETVTVSYSTAPTWSWFGL